MNVFRSKFPREFRAFQTKIKSLGANYRIKTKTNSTFDVRSKKISRYPRTGERIDNKKFH